MHPKYIVQKIDDQLVLIISKVKYHKELVVDNKFEDVTGGGWWNRTNEGNYFLSQSSHDFGQASLEDVQQAASKGLVFGDYELEEKIDKYDLVYYTGTEEVFVEIFREPIQTT